MFSDNNSVKLKINNGKIAGKLPNTFNLEIKEHTSK